MLQMTYKFLEQILMLFHCVYASDVLLEGSSKCWCWCCIIKYRNDGPTYNVKRHFSDRRSTSQLKS